ncbi:uncharacterized protein [Mytilus edulis]|uniref:uncharacterized protein n=1 Tax=Mytilus edulis TaxID=6550 RepID=UPI0039F01342
MDIKIQEKALLMFVSDVVGVPDSQTFDVTLMICLIRNLTATSQPNNGFDSLPLPVEITVCADLARIKWYRNKLAHHESNTIDNVYFRTAWSVMSAALSRLGGQPMNQECQDLKVKILDQSNQDIMLEIKQSQIETIELRQTVEILKIEHSEVTKSLMRLQDSHSSLQTENLEVIETLTRLQDSYSSLQSEHSNVKESLGELHTEHSEVTKNLKRLQDSYNTLKTEHAEVTEILKDPIPCNIKGRIKEELEAWKEDDQLFVETHGAKSVLKCIKENGCVVVTGSSVYKNEIDQLQTEGANVKYSALALCVMFNNHLKEEWLTEDKNKDIITIIKNTFEACKVVKGTSRLVPRDELDSLSQTFIRIDGGWYRTIHDKLFDFLVFYFGSAMIHYLLDNASSSLIGSRFLFKKEVNSDECIIIVPKQYQKIYINRLVEDRSKGNVQDVFCNINMNRQFFRQRLLLHIQGLEISKQKQLASLYDKHTNSTPLIQCCYIGYIDMVTWCLRHCIGNINHCRNDSYIALLFALMRGYTDLLQMYVDNMADTEQSRDSGASPLNISYQDRYADVDHMSINNTADINRHVDVGVFPLIIACGNGHTEIVQMLINNKAEINNS